MATRDTLLEEFMEKASKLSLRGIRIMLVFIAFLKLIEATPAEKDTLLEEFMEKASKLSTENPE